MDASTAAAIAGNVAVAGVVGDARTTEDVAALVDPHRTGQQHGFAGGVVLDAVGLRFHQHAVVVFLLKQGRFAQQHDARDIAVLAADGGVRGFDPQRALGDDDIGQQGVAVLGNQAIQTAGVHVQWLVAVTGTRQCRSAGQQQGAAQQDRPQRRLNDATRKRGCHSGR